MSSKHRGNLSKKKIKNKKSPLASLGPQSRISVRLSTHPNRSQASRHLQPYNGGESLHSDHVRPLSHCFKIEPLPGHWTLIHHQSPAPEKMFPQFGATAETLSKASTMVFRIGTDAHLYDDPDDVSIAPLLDSKFDSEKCEALKRLLALIAQGFDVSNFFPQVTISLSICSVWLIGKENHERNRGK